MIFVYSSVGIVSIYIFYMYLIKPTIIRKKITNNISLLKEGYEFSFWVSDNVNYDYIIRNKANRFLIKVLVIPSNSAITVNSRNTWSLAWGGNTKNRGRLKKHNKILENMSSFLNIKVKEEDVKIIYLYKTTEKIQKYLNESEIEIFEYGDWCYDYKVTSHNTLKQDFIKLKEN